MKMNPGMAPEEVVWERLLSFFQKAHNDALLEVVQIIAKRVGIERIDGLPVDEFFHQRMRKIAQDLVADYADTFPNMASQIKRKWG
jgi:hypothetical protein